jgi:thiamine biosynthesis protein ThiS
MKAEFGKVLVNGQTQEISLPCTVAQFLANHGWKPTQVVVEYNGNILPRSEMEIRAIQDGDKLEIIVPVAGG